MDATTIRGMRSVGEVVKGIVRKGGKKLSKTREKRERENNCVWIYSHNAWISQTFDQISVFFFFFFF